jgi:hydroxyacylglutathione hydrolase
MLTITPLPAFDDNYIWLLQYGRQVIVVDPGDATPVIDMLQEKQLSLSAILITHHHHDHIGGVQALLNFQQAPVYAPIYGKYPFATIPVQEGDTLNFAEFNLTLNVLWLPGHTLDHVAYYNQALLFCGDVLFSAGCGRLFEGTAEQMLTSLNRLKLLPKTTQVFCTHEYTNKNIAFALMLDPDNLMLKQRQKEVTQLRSQNLPSLPSTIGLELVINPFLRCNQDTIIHHANANSSIEIDVFTAIRTLRNTY